MISLVGRACADNKQAVCRKCVVELSAVKAGIITASSGSSGSGKDTIIRLCKVCSENRELIKKSGAWFYKVGIVLTMGKALLLQEVVVVHYKLALQAPLLFCPEARGVCSSMCTQKKGKANSGVKKITRVF